MEKFEISNFLTKIDNSRGNCIRCNKIIGWARDKVACHYRICGDDEQKKFFNMMKSKSRSRSSTTSESETSESDLSTSPDIEIPAAKRSKIDSVLSQFVFNTGISFRVVESPYFKKLINELNPAYAEQIPNRQKLSTKLLDEEYSAIKNELDRMLQETVCGLTLITDGWTNVRKDHLVNFCIKFPCGKTFFYKSINTSAIIQDARQVANQIIDVLREIGDAKFCGVVTDNANVMQAAWKLIEAEFPRVSANGCAAHCLNLLIEDIVKTTDSKSLLEESSSLIKYINNHARVRSVFEAARKTANVAHALSLPVITRWYTQYNSANDLLNAKFVIRNLLDSKRDLFTSREVNRVIASNNFWDRLAKFIGLIEYPTKIIGKFNQKIIKQKPIFNIFFPF